MIKIQWVLKYNMIHKNSYFFFLAARFFNDSCADDSYCYTFGKAGYCAKQENTVFKTCECDESISYKDEINRMCVLFNKGYNGF